MICAWCARDAHGAANSGRAVKTSRSGAVAPCSTRSPKSSRVEASTQCRSSTTTIMGCTRANPQTQAVNVLRSFRRCCSADRPSGA